MPNASCSRPVWPSALISAGPDAPARTDRTGSRASGSVSTVSNVNGRKKASSPAMPNGTSSVSTYPARLRASPSMTASVRLPATVSVPMSRRLLTISRAQASSPAGTEAARPSQVSVFICTYAVPATATTPKHRNTNTSPSPLYP